MHINNKFRTSIKYKDVAEFNYPYKCHICQRGYFSKAYVEKHSKTCDGTHAIIGKQSKAYNTWATKSTIMMISEEPLNIE